ncbi:MAG: Hsp20/alpha crystallin family protein [Phycisphaerae bacterium]|jgi:HSP20 family molecular chaperone IbpA
MTTEMTDKPEHSEVVRAEHTRPGRHYRPNVDIVEHSQELLVLADMPGVTSDGVDINFENGTLAIHGRVEEREREGVTALQQEYGVGDFYRTFQVSEKIDAASITAEFGNGVLTLHMPKVEAVKPRKISVDVK